MKVPFHLRRRPEAGAVEAAWLAADGVESILELLAVVDRPDRLPMIFRAGDGFLLVLERHAGAPAGTIRLRRQAPNLFLPADSDLVPAPLDDEAEGLTRHRGLVFLPGGRILAFDPGTRLSASSLVRSPIRMPDATGWVPFPGRPTRPDRIAEIVVAMPGTIGPDEAFGPATGGDGAGESDGAAAEPGQGPRPGAAGAAATLAGRAILGMGRGLMAVGSALGIKGLAALGAGWVDRAVRQAPRLSEAIFGKQDASLRELLRQFRDGEVDRALRHALPLGGEGGRGDVPGAGSRLPEVDPTYSVGSLFGTGRGGGGIWYSAAAVQAELAREYRKAADEAERRGDFRRAAYIRGRLLNEFPAAAALLTRAGLHRDAALIYLDRIGDEPSAARCFEAAGDLDRALRIYQARSMHGEAGDLLRRLGEDEAAVAEYVLAAGVLAADSKRGLLAAGDLLRDRAGRADLAQGWYLRGWDLRPAPNSVECALRILDHRAERGESSAILDLVERADALFEADGSIGSIPEFYNALARVAELGPLESSREELRDRALAGLAANLRRAVALGRPGQLVSSHLGRFPGWSPDLVADASFAMLAARERSRAGRATGTTIAVRSGQARVRRIDLRAGTITAACHAPASGEVFLGFEDGAVDRVDLARGVVERLASHEGLAVAGLSVDADGSALACLFERRAESFLLYFDRSSRSRAAGHTCWHGQATGAWITNLIGVRPTHSLGLWDGAAFRLLFGVRTLAAGPSLTLGPLEGRWPAAILLPPDSTDPSSKPSLLVHDGLDICHVHMSGRTLGPLYLGWRPSLSSPGNTLRSVPLSWLRADDRRVELAGLDGDGLACGTSLKLTPTELIRTSKSTRAPEAPLRAVALVRPGLLACVGDHGVEWVRAGGNACTLAGLSAVRLGRALACFADPGSNELVVVCGDGTLACLPVPP